MKEIYWGYYAISKNGILRRNKPGRGTYVGRIIHPYDPTGRGTQKYVSLYINGRRYQKNFAELLMKYN